MTQSTEAAATFFPATYGGKACTASPMAWRYGPLKGTPRFDSFYVMLDKDPGFGSMSFPSIHRSQLAFLVEPPPFESQYV